MEARTSHGPSKTQGQRGVGGQGGGWHAGGVCPALKAVFFFFSFSFLLMLTLVTHPWWTRRGFGRVRP